MQQAYLDKQDMNITPPAGEPRVDACPYAKSVSFLIVSGPTVLRQVLPALALAAPLSVHLAADGESAWNFVLHERVDLAIIDAGLPENDGFTLLTRLRRRSDMPVLMLIESDGDTERLMGLRCGASDYVRKPVDFDILWTRLHGCLRRQVSQADAASRYLQVGDLSLDSASSEVRVGGNQIYLTAAETSILTALMRRPGAMISREHLTETALGRSIEPLDRSLDTHISNLRRKLGLRAGQEGRPQIRSYRNRGYALMMPADDAPA
ncbi:response regulator transcription factor [Kerstersia gyiorum]|uniref:Two-component system response regulator CpxR n=1 Tax=Kerstersia gyiorum TaxID=206506 RepID=A0A4Q7MHQ8_9BURK|nr:response regulator transcription factor [Kerstersia gyiorum]AZV94103.1 DNA-binding response regulator [Bordetella sp. J329]MCO7637732.1 response regulator transcription factor [Pseudomonas sp. S 311-6]KAB0541617.1 response regulator transcription factor [Kerstersia gyiorum]MCP1633151.1 DNA-binding response OmpR family regulator [Kerstersia gyiorum]MCP1636402.1 DNA-binding response OmpR family regulator [Kerstersia gyiorum]